MKKFKLLVMALLATFIILPQTTALAGYGAYFYLRPYTINSPVSTPHALKKIDYDPAVVNLYYGYIPGGELDFSVRHSDGARATTGFTARGNYLHQTDYMSGEAWVNYYYRLYAAFYSSDGTQGTTTGGRWAP